MCFNSRTVWVSQDVPFSAALMLSDSTSWLQILWPHPRPSAGFEISFKISMLFFPPVLFSPPVMFLSGLIVSSGNNYFSCKRLVPWGCFFVSLLVRGHAKLLECPPTCNECAAKGLSRLKRTERRYWVMQPCLARAIGSWRVSLWGCDSMEKEG